MNCYITGDCHGDFGRFESFCDSSMNADQDGMIVLGDFGANFYRNDRGIISKKEWVCNEGVDGFAFNETCRTASK